MYGDSHVWNHRAVLVTSRMVASTFGIARTLAEIQAIHLRFGFLILNEGTN